MFNKEKFKALISESFLGDYIDHEYVYAHETPDNEDDLRDQIETMINEYQVIYYHKAMKYLAENDPSLSESLELAHDCGYSCNQLNSETLATLHIQQKMMESIPDLSKCFDD